MGHLPFVDRVLNDGVIEVLSQNCGKIGSEEDIEAICPGLPAELQTQIMEIHREIFGELSCFTN